jgi:hypothetical protein
MQPLNFNNKMTIAVEFLDIKKPLILYAISIILISTNLIKLISSFLLQRKLSFYRRRHIYTKDIEAGVPKVP